MRRFAVLLLILFAANADAQNASSEDVARQVAAQFRGKTILALGESSHENPSPHRVLARLVSLLSQEIEYIGLEMSSDAQDDVDALLSGSLDRAAVLWDSGAGSDALINILPDLLAVNHVRAIIGLAPIRVLALDMPQTEEITAKEWFTRRDRHMFDLLAAGSDSFRQKGILFFGAAHLLRQQVAPIPVMREQLGVDTPIHPLGERLNSVQKLDGRILNVWINTSLPVSELGGVLPPEYLPIYRIGQAFANAAPLALSTRSDAFLQAEAESLAGDRVDWTISGNFDIYVEAETCSAKLEPTS